MSCEVPVEVLQSINFLVSVVVSPSEACKFQTSVLALVYYGEPFSFLEVTFSRTKLLGRRGQFTHMGTFV